jgi:hypothetical protein
MCARLLRLCLLLSCESVNACLCFFFAPLLVRKHVLFVNQSSGLQLDERRIQWPGRFSRAQVVRES